MQPYVHILRSIRSTFLMISPLSTNYFHMMMIVDANGADKEFASLVKDLEKIGENLGVQIKMQHEEIFDIMHRI